MHSMEEGILSESRKSSRSANGSWSVCFSIGFISLRSLVCPKARFPCTFFLAIKVPASQEKAGTFSETCCNFLLWSVFPAQSDDAQHNGGGGAEGADDADDKFGDM